MIFITKQSIKFLTKISKKDQEILNLKEQLKNNPANQALKKETQKLEEEKKVLQDKLNAQNKIQTNVIHFKTSKSKFFLDVAKFNIISKKTDRNIIALGGINESNINKLKMVSCNGLSSIGWIKKNRPKKIGRFYNFKCLTN